MTGSLAASTFLVILVGELADKSRAVGLILAAAYRKPWPVFWGMTLAYAVLDGVAVLAGTWLHASLSPRLVCLGAGALFTGVGAAAFLWAEEAEEGARRWLEKAEAWGPFAVSFAAVAAAELGDRTQLAAAALSAESGRPWTVFAAALAALASLNAVTVALGGWLSARLDIAKVQKAGGALFLALGLALLYKGLS